MTLAFLLISTLGGCAFGPRALEGSHHLYNDSIKLVGEEELLVVIDGHGRLRTPDGWQTLERGAVLSFLTGEDGAHQVVNDGEVTLVFLAVSTAGAPDICIYPDAGKLGAFERGPNGTGVWEFYRREDEAGYWSGVEPPTSTD